MGDLGLVRYEQAVYGSFPFWDRGYAVLAASPGCRPGWVAALTAACARFGEPPRGAEGPAGLFSLRLPVPGEVWAVVGAAVVGADDRGRPGALAFHALLVTGREFRQVGYDPFALAPAHRRDWSAATTALPAGTLEATRTPPPPGPVEDRARRIAAALARGRRVAVESPRPIDDLARAAWAALPTRARRRLSVATWAFANGNRFDLIALPRLAGAAFDRTYTDLHTIESGEGAGLGAPRLRPVPGRVLAGAAGVAVAAGVAAGLAWEAGGTPSRPASAPVATAARPVDRSYPDPASFAAESLPADERALVAEGLIDLAERFGVSPAGASDPPTLMTRLADRLRYRGPLLTAAERSRLAAEPDPSRDRARAWDAHIRRFVPDRPLPADFARGPLRWQLATLAWSYHLDDPAPRGLSAAEVPHHLAEALAVDVSTLPTPLAGRYPALAAYARFLDRLPRR